MSTYQDLFTWSYPLKSDNHDTRFIEHHDGAVSCAITWSGISPENAPTKNDQDAMYLDYYQFIEEVARCGNIIVENHFERSADYSLAKKYIEYGERNVIRSKELGLKLRSELAHHLSAFARGNRIMTVLVMVPERTSGLLKANNKKRISELRDKLAIAADRLISFLPDSSFLNYSQYFDEIVRRADRDTVYEDIAKPFNPRFYMNQQLIKKPEYIDFKGVKLIKSGNTYSQVFLFIDYPDAKANWFYQLAETFGVDVTVSQIIRPLNTKGVMGQSSREHEKAKESASRAGGESVLGKIRDMGDYREYVANNNLEVFANCYILQFHSQNPDDLISTSEEIRRGLVRQGVNLITGREKVDFPAWRIAMPGQGYKTDFSRDDHTWQIAHMAPIIKFDQGETEELQLLRLTSQGTLVGDRYVPEVSNHRLTAAKTGSGKSVMQASEIAELYPLGTNFYVTEVGRSFEWQIKLFGGDYFVLDAESTVVSPFPAFELEYIKDDQDPESEDSNNGPLPASVLTPTIQSVMPVLLGRSDWKNMEGLIHYKLVAEQTLQACYLDYFIEMFGEGLSAPTLLTYQQVLNYIIEDGSAIEDDESLEAAKHIHKTLNAFLKTQEGKIFRKADSIDFKKPLIGVDFSELTENGNDDLAKFMLTFIGMRFRQLSFTTSNPCFIEMDEYHEFVAIDKPLISTLERQITRRGRKRGAYFNPISQAVLDMVVSDDDNKESNINQYTHKYLMYYGSDFGSREDNTYIPDIFRMPKRAIDIWTNFKPVSKDRPYAQCLRINEDKFYDYLLSYPQVMLDITDSTRASSDLKMAINKMTDDPIERLELFRKEKECKGSVIKEEVDHEIESI